MKCPNCGREGAVALRNINGTVEGHCNLCVNEFVLPVWWAIGKGYNGTKGAEEVTTMQVSYNGFTAMQIAYNGFTGELLKLERSIAHPNLYDLEIYDREKNVRYSFDCVKPAAINFIGAVSFGG